MRITWLVVVTMVALVFGCAAGDEGTGAGGGGGGRTTGVETTTNTGGSPGAGGAGGGQGGQGGGQGGQGGAGGGLSGEIELCVLNEGDAFGICQMPEELDFGVVGSGTKETRKFRIDNETFEDVLFQQVDVSSTAFEIKAVRFEEDPGNPGNYLRVEQSLPVTRASGQSLWFEVEYTATGNSGPLPSQNVVVKMNVDGNPIANLLVPITGEETGCPAGLGACDSDPANGCETNIDTSNDHCGNCNQPCDPLNGTGQCSGGTCELTGCDPYFQDCDMNPGNGCEVSLLNDVLNCGMCGNDCNKANTNAFCSTGNCNIIGCLNNYGDCNLSAADGCETNLANNMNHCGGCNLNCDLPNASESCIPSLLTGLGVCTLNACDAGFQNCNLAVSDGCEVNTTNDLNNCGNCFNVCSFANAGASCVSSACQMGACNPGFANCDSNPITGCEVNLLVDKDHCGNCATDCDVVYPNTDNSCFNGTCQMGACLPGFWDLDGNPANGCEYACNFISSNDDPDDSFVDANCDGIDGRILDAIFVATTGNDSWPGTKAQPVATIAAAIGKATAQGKPHVYVSNGTYTGRVSLASGVSLYGGYSASNNWARSAAYTSTISSTTVSGGRMTALEGSSINQTTVVDRFSIQTSSTSQAGVSNYAVYCTSCSALILKNNQISAGNAGPGTNGGNGSNGANGSTGFGGSNGSCDGNGPGAPGGAGGASTCGRAGGAGGKGGADGSNAGSTGGTGQIGTPGGTGGAGGSTGKDGNNGSNGSNGSAGSAGAAGSGGVGTATGWVSSGGGAGGTGNPGNGGGGGGGGGGQGCTLCNDGQGNGAGGGGSGGCGGGGASGGTGGGGSFGLFLVNSTGISLIGNTISSGSGGNGGQGGSGGGGGTGANGGAGATNCNDEIGEGGDGGKGGNGGQGGGGGGGAGGPSYAVYRVNTSVSTVGNSLSNGSGGSGGTGGFPNGNNGAAGASGTLF